MIFGQNFRWHDTSPVLLKSLFKLVRWYYLSSRGGCPLALLSCIQTQMKKLIIPNHSSHFIRPWHALRTSHVLRTTFDVPDHIDRKPVISDDVRTLHSFWKCQTSNSGQYTLELWTLDNIHLNCEHLWLLNFVHIMTLHLLIYMWYTAVTEKNEQFCAYKKCVILCWRTLQNHWKR